MLCAVDPTATAVAIVIQGTVTTASPTDWRGVLINAVLVLGAAVLGVGGALLGAWMQRTATFDAAREQARAENAQRVRDNRRASSGLILQQARIRVGIVEKLVDALKTNRPDVALTLLERFFAVDAGSDDLLADSIDDVGFRLAATYFFQTHRGLRVILLDKGRPLSFQLMEGHAIGPVDRLKEDLDRMQKAADDWVGSPV